ncbi:hypothetical protein QFZ60_001599 [Arthrobacter sp. B2I5]|uniref:tape measure protein n=1 Tax=Arthrobacter sp. B2I5 TaxID=3042266 RepID=UPI00277E8C76|nr:tape measure protein [Arthrobacter sp. B2I5]MDQ0825426.1 hypothetical protein [Arthrobacter sp. B2I5]
MASNNSIDILIQARDAASKVINDAVKNIEKAAASASEANKELSKSGKTTAADLEAASKKSDGFGSSLGTLAGQVRFAATAFLTYKLGQLVSDFASSSVQAAGQLEQTNLAFQSLTGNVEMANSVFAQLVQYANVTPFESADIEKAAQTLMSFGTQGQQTVDIIKQLGDVTSVGGGDLQALSLVTGQVFAQGKMRAQDMYQVINDGGAGLIKVMAENAGGMQKLTDEFDKGGIPAQQFFDAITQSTQKGGFAFEGANKQADTFNGRLSTLKDSATQFGEKLIGVHIDPALGLQIQPGGLFDRMKGMMGDLTGSFSAWGAAAGDVVPKILDWFDRTSQSLMRVYTAVSNYLSPKLSDLWKSFKDNILPILTDLWHNVLEPLIPVLGTALVGAIGAVVDIASSLFKGIGFVYQQIKDGNPLIWTLIGAFGTLATVMAFNAIFDALTVGFATFRLVTIPSLIATMDTIAASSAGVAAKQIASFAMVSAQAVAHAVVTATAWTVSAVKTSTTWVVTELPKIIASFAATAAKATVHAVATSAAWVASAAKTSAIWVVTELPKIIGSFALVALKASLHAADTALAWTLNAVRVSLVWTTTEMPKLVASFTTTAAKAGIHAAATSAAWVTSAAKTSAVWIATELPRIVTAFVTTSASAVKQAVVSSAAWIVSASQSAAAWIATELPRIVSAFIATSSSASREAVVSSAAWVASASRSAVAWAVTELPRIISGFIAASASAVANAAVSSAAWVSAAVTSSQSFAAFSALVATPIVMPAIAVGAALAAIASVWNAYNNMMSAIEQAKATQAQFNQESLKTSQHFLGILNDGVSSPRQKELARQYLHNTGFPGYATGTSFAPGGLAGLAETGAELVTAPGLYNLPTGAKVHTARETKQILSGGGGASIQIGSVHIHNEMDQQRFLKDLGWRLALS